MPSKPAKPSTAPRTAFKRPPVQRSPFGPPATKPPADPRRARFFAVDNGRAFVLLDDGTCCMATPSNPNWSTGPFPKCPWFPQMPGAKP